MSWPKRDGPYSLLAIWMHWYLVNKKQFSGQILYNRFHGPPYAIFRWFCNFPRVIAKTVKTSHWKFLLKWNDKVPTYIENSDNISNVKVFTEGPYISKVGLPKSAKMAHLGIWRHIFSFLQFLCDTLLEWSLKPVGNWYESESGQMVKVALYCISMQNKKVESCKNI